MHKYKYWITTWFLLFSIIILSSFRAVTADTRCLINRPEVNPKRYLHYESRSHNITLEVSNRLSHQLSTEIFRIFLSEVLGYSRTDIVYEQDNFDVEDIMDRLSGPRTESNNTVPKTMINLEVWAPPELDTILLQDSHHVRECGYLAPPGRFGWFIPSQLATSLWNFEKRWSPDMQDIHWTIFRDSQAVKAFDINDPNDMALIAKNAMDLKRKKYFCNSPLCQKGIYEPELCRGTRHKQVPCALLLTSHYNVTKFVIEHINELKLYVKVVWLGDNLKHVVAALKKNYVERNSTKTFVLLSWIPSDVIMPESKFVGVTFKRCELLNSSLTIGCKYEMTRLLKVAWSKLETFAKPAFDSIHRMTFTHKEYNDLIERYNGDASEKTPSEVACDWMLQSEHIWANWIPTDVSKPKLYIGGIFPIHGSTYTAKGIINGALMAKDAVKRSSILRDYNLDLLVADGQCRADMVMKSFIDIIMHTVYNDLVGILGPACSDTVEPLAGVSKHYKTMIISYSAEGASFSDRNKYPYFFRTIGENQQYKHVYLQILQKLGWRRVAALTEDGQKYTEYISHLHALLHEKGITFIANIKFPREREKNGMTRYLEDLKSKTARIIIADMYDEVARSLMCAAYKLKMTAYQGYVWFLPLWLSHDWYNTTYYNVKYNETVNCTTEQMIEAINGYLSMHHAYFAPDNETMQENITVGEWRQNYETRCRNSHVGSSNYAGYAYDAVWTYAYALDKLVHEDPQAMSDLHSENTTNKFLEIIKATDFKGVSGRIKFRGGPSRFSVINIVQWLNTTGTNVIGKFHPLIPDDKPIILNGTLELNDSAIVWLSENGLKPDDGTPPPKKCVFDGIAEALDVECEAAIVVFNILVFGTLLVFVISAIWFVKKRYDKKVQLTQQYMKALGIDLLSAANMPSLDKWEIPRESVVINRKLGEGAFGTVYGGEANFPDTGWLAIAVKTLKVGSTTEEKLDFLSEAEVMKRFDHKNIVRLLGVCTKNEPVYTVMEFMLYGDLKTFLLARRHLVNDGKSCEESEEVSSKKLTAMALDIVRALSYLAELKYVHRDIASRNCLINGQRIVKLGDFGMTRPMFENDYYKFNRKGMLPVRWMSPESLALGVFTPASDVWSYGVLLYEIITFGNFPFQGLSNNQVLEHVKAGNTINIPSGVKPQLEGLIKSCWKQDHKLRPHASEIVEFLANNPRLLSPNLDVPLSSVQMEDTGQLDMQLPEQFRKCSISLSFNKNGLLPNGTSSSSFDMSNLRQNSIIDSGVSLQLENCGPREPLLGPPVRSNSLMGLSKYVTIQPNRPDSNFNQNNDYCNHDQGQAVSKV